MEDPIDRAFAPVANAIAEGRIPGAVLGVLGRGRSIRHGGLARITPSTPMRADTVFDLASLTKPIFTASAILRHVEQGRIALDDTLASVIPDLRQYDVAHAAERRLTFRQCLAHQTHLPAVEPLYTYGQDPATLRAFILQRAWRPRPAVYSDINYLLLGIVLERLAGRPLSELDTGFGFSFRPDPAACAATEFCHWRGRVLQGEVHDENAFAMGGAAGHAGLFGNADAVLDFAAALLEGRLLGTEGVAGIRTVQGGSRTLGWEAAHAGWSGGATCSPDTIGHTGFTGTGLWIDWDRRLAWTLLTNRVHPSRHVETGIFELRRAVGEAVCA
jgi:CubicO group peptidase (beta-lactamase class C family)